MADAFLERLQIADHKAKKHYPNARFFSATQDGFYEESPWTFTFLVPGDGGKPPTTLNLFWAAGEFTLDHSNANPAGAREIKLPISLGVEAAESVLRASGVHGVITHIELAWPNFENVTQPYYTFEVHPDVWFVGVNDRKMQKSPIATEKQVKV